MYSFSCIRSLYVCIHDEGRLDDSVKTKEVSVSVLDIIIELQLQFSAAADAVGRSFGSEQVLAVASIRIPSCLSAHSSVGIAASPPCLTNE